MFVELKTFIESYFEGVNQVQGIIKLVFDILIVIGLIVLFFIAIRQKLNIKRVLFIFGIYAFMLFIALMFNLSLLITFMKYVVSWAIGFIVIIYAPEIKAALDSKAGKDRNDNIYSSKKEKAEVINVICSTVEYLSKRRIGALITFERKDSLESLIQKAIPINADISQEILTTIFTPGTACHDGGIIIRNNKIVCAGAYYPLSDNYDIPKFLGTRHRAAIGVSERYDTITIIVSEETGNISIAIAGNINLELTIERVGVLLDGYLSVK